MGAHTSGRPHETRGILDAVRRIVRELHESSRAAEKQVGLSISYERSGTGSTVNGTASIHVYRVLQEALNNVSRHAGVQEAWVRLMYKPDALVLEIEDHGKGIDTQKNERGIGLVAMRERAELISGHIEYLQPNGSGMLVRMSAPREKVEAHGG